MHSAATLLASICCCLCGPRRALFQMGFPRAADHNAAPPSSPRCEVQSATTPRCAPVFAEDRLETATRHDVIGQSTRSRRPGRGGNTSSNGGSVPVCVPPARLGAKLSPPRPKLGLPAGSAERTDWRTHSAPRILNSNASHRDGQLQTQRAISRTPRTSKSRCAPSNRSISEKTASVPGQANPTQ